jgi:hypothetical protein
MTIIEALLKAETSELERVLKSFKRYVIVFLDSDSVVKITLSDSLINHNVPKGSLGHIWERNDLDFQSLIEEILEERQNENV